MKTNRSLSILLLFLIGIAPEALARIKLITLPVRERVEIQLDHPSVTLVEEERIVPVVKGVNQIDFSWANTRIDPDTLVFRVLGPAGVVQNLVFRVLGPAGGAENSVKVLSVSYPPNENALIWSVAAAKAGAARVRISYVLGNLNKSFSYRAIAAHDEKKLELSQYLRVENYANEEFGESGLWAGFGKRFLRPVGMNENKKILMQKYRQVPVKKTYSSDPVSYGYIDKPKDKLRVPMHYVLKNNLANNLGQAALPYGKVRIFQDDGKGGTAFIGENWAKFTPRDDELELYLGVAQDIAVKRTIAKSEQKRVSGNLYHHDVLLKYEIENFKDTPVTLDVTEHLRNLRNEVRRDNGREAEWEIGQKTTFKRGLDKEKSTFDKAVFHVRLPGRKSAAKAKKIVRKLHIILKNEW